MDGQTFTGLLQVIVLSITAYIVWKYTKETERLRLEAQKQVGAAHKQIEVAQQQVAETQRQIEVQQRPFVILTPEARQGDLKGLKVQNIGNSAAINIRIVLDGEPTILPVLVQGESIAGPVIPIDQGDIAQAQAATQRRYREENPYDLRFPLRDESITDGFQFIVQYQNVAMEPYETVERLWPCGFEIIRSGKRVASNS
jgi:predicted RNA-binding protein with TRAM domain